jgi:hypothetical protein
MFAAKYTSKRNSLTEVAEMSDLFSGPLHPIQVLAASLPQNDAV